MSQVPDPTLAQQKERTLLIACLLSAWAPLACGIAVILGPSSILIADFLRRSSELVVLIASWQVFRRAARNGDASSAHATLSERRTSALVAGVMLLSMVLILLSGTFRFAQGAEMGWILPGLLIACAGGGVNFWLWRRHRGLDKRAPSPLIDAQWRFYRGKTFVDACVIVTLLAGAALRGSYLSGYVDAAGALLIASVLGLSARRVLQHSVGVAPTALQTAPEIPGAASPEVRA